MKLYELISELVKYPAGAHVNINFFKDGNFIRSGELIGKEGVIERDGDDDSCYLNICANENKE